jgi:gas vesicle protein
MSAGKIALGVVAGLAVGAIAGILFAPDKGSETRKKIAKKSTDLFNDLKEKITAASEQATNHVEPAETFTQDNA